MQPFLQKLQSFGCRRLISQYFCCLKAWAMQNPHTCKNKARCCPAPLHDYCHWLLGTAPRARGCSRSRGGKAQLLTWELWKKHRGGNFLHLLQLLLSANPDRKSCGGNRLTFILFSEMFTPTPTRPSYPALDGNGWAELLTWPQCECFHA